MLSSSVTSKGRVSVNRVTSFDNTDIRLSVLSVVKFPMVSLFRSLLRQIVTDLEDRRLRLKRRLLETIVVPFELFASPPKAMLFGLVQLSSKTENWFHGPISILLRGFRVLLSGQKVNSHQLYQLIEFHLFQLNFLYPQEKFSQQVSWNEYLYS